MVEIVYLEGNPPVDKGADRIDAPERIEDTRGDDSTMSDDLPRLGDIMREQFRELYELREIPMHLLHPDIRHDMN